MFKLLSFLRQRKRDDSAEPHSDTFFRNLADQVGDVIAHVGTDQKFTYISPSVERLLGFTQSQLIQDGMLPVLEEDRAALFEMIERHKSENSTESRIEARLLRADGQIIWIETVAKATEANDGSAVLVVRDVTERKRMEEKLAQLAYSDGLTSLGNRRLFDQLLTQEWSRALREQGQMALLLIDVDHFKHFNDEYGHQAGDDCLRSVSSSIKSSLYRPGDAAFRYGGEEMAVILAGTDRDGAVETAERVRKAVASLAIPHARSSAEKYVTISVGAAAATARQGGPISMPEELLQAADQALYRAKNEGRNRTCDCVL